MKSIFMFAAASLILVVGIVIVAVSNAVHAEKPLQGWCFPNDPVGFICFPDKKTCEGSPQFVKGETKCKNITNKIN